MKNEKVTQRVLASGLSAAVAQQDVYYQPFVP